MNLAQDLAHSYAELDLEPGANAEDVRAAYRKLAKEYHPDLNPGALGVMMGRVNRAYDRVMSHLASQESLRNDPDLRYYQFQNFDLERNLRRKEQAAPSPAQEETDRAPQREDETQRPGAQPQSPEPPSRSPYGLFAGLQRRFGGVFHTGRTRTHAETAPPRPAPCAWRLLEVASRPGKLVYRVQVSGRPEMLSLPVRCKRPCPQCGGTGRYESPQGASRCPSCGGKGSLTRADRIGVSLPADWVHGQEISIKPSGAQQAISVELLRAEGDPEA